MMEEVSARKVTTKAAPQIESMTVRREEAPVKGNGAAAAKGDGDAVGSLKKQMVELQRAQAQQEFAVTQQLQYRMERNRLATAMQMSKQALSEALEGQKCNEAANAIAILVEVAVRQLALGVRQ
jgi:hypothetical protein